MLSKQAERKLMGSLGSWRAIRVRLGVGDIGGREGEGGGLCCYESCFVMMFCVRVL